jgi:hypothetical protein
MVLPTPTFSWPQVGCCQSRRCGVARLPALQGQITWTKLSRASRGRMAPSAAPRLTSYKHVPAHVSTRCCCAFYRHWCIWRMRMAVLGNHSSCNGLLRHDQRHAVLSCQSLCAKPPPLRPKAVVHHTCPRHGGECRNFGRVLKHAPRSVGVSTRLLCLLSHCGACTDCGELERHRGLGWLDDLPTEHRTVASIRCAPSQAKPSLQCCSAQAALRHNALLSGGHGVWCLSLVSRNETLAKVSHLDFRSVWSSGRPSFCTRS